MKKKFLAVGLIGLALLLSACTSPATKPTPSPQATAEIVAPAANIEQTEAIPAANQTLATAVPAKLEYKKLSAQDAKARIDSGDELIILDVREDYEFAQGHIPGAVLLPLGQIAQKAGETLPQKDAEILLYCRSGNRSRQAANQLIGLGYTNVYDFGGILSWPYEVVK